LRQDYDKFLAQDAELLVVGPEDADAFRRYWSDHNLPFPGLPDPKHSVLKLYGQQVKLFKFGRMPAQVIVDINGIARFVHYGKNMSDIPSNEEILAVLA
jgi:peroxiredoxin Q/BCP